jgi:broad-specificity NMP kinase
MIIQLIGLPGVGKSTLLKNINSIKKIDIKDFNCANRELEIVKYVSKINENLIIESACGIEIENSIVILVKKNKKQVIQQLQSRGESEDFYDLQAIEDQMIASHYTVYDANLCCSIIEKLVQS